MCGSLRRENLDKQLGNPVPFYTPGSSCPMIDANGKSIEGFWNGHAREETLQDKFLSKGYSEGRLDVTHYTEGHKGNRKMYQVPTGQRIKVVYKRIPNGKTIFHIVTREAVGRELEVHPRFPRCI